MGDFHTHTHTHTHELQIVHTHTHELELVCFGGERGPSDLSYKLPNEKRREMKGGEG
jgi:hypothetical protein